MNKRQALMYGITKFTALFTAAVYLLTVPASYIILPYHDGLILSESILTTALSGAMFFWASKTAYRIVKI